MAIQKYDTHAGRINKLKGEILACAVPVEVLGITGSHKKMPKNKGDTVVFRRFYPFGGVDNQWVAPGGDTTLVTAHLTAEGVTPTADTLEPKDITATLQEYSALYAVTNKTVDLYEDDIPAEMKKQTGKRIGLVREMVRFGELKSYTNAYFSGGTSRVTVDEPITLRLLRNCTRSIKASHGELVTSILAPSPNYATSAIEASYLVFCHTDCESDIRDLSGFTPVAEYGSRKVVHEQEIGSCENFRFILSPELVAYMAAGAAVGATGMFAANATNLDVYPVIITAEDAWGDVCLRGADSIDVTYIAPGQKDKNDPLGQRGYIGASTWFTAKILNDGWMCVAEVAVKDLA